MTGGDLALLGLRVLLGAIYIAHGARKLGWGNPNGFGGFRASIGRRGYRPAAFWAVTAVVAEVVGGALAVLGLLTPLAGAALVGQGVTIVGLSAPKGFWHDKGGVEYPLVLTGAAFVVALVGPGALSLDAWLGVRLDGVVGVVLAVGAALGAVAGLVTRRPPAA